MDTKRYRTLRLVLSTVVLMTGCFSLAKGDAGEVSDPCVIVDCAVDMIAGASGSSEPLGGGLLLPLAFYGGFWEDMAIVFAGGLLVFLFARWLSSVMGIRDADIEEIVQKRTEKLLSQASALKRKNEQLEESVSNATRQASLLQQSDLAKSRFLAGMSHEIRIPMNGILSRCKLLDDLLPNDERRELLGSMKVTGESLLTLASDILDFTKIDAGRIQFERLPFNLCSCLEDVIRFLGPNLSESEVRLCLKIEDDLRLDRVGDARRLRQVFARLVGNAIKLAAGCEIVIVVRSDEESSDELGVVVEIRDTGIGMSLEDAEVIFDPFSSKEIGDRALEGAGLGLSICKSLIEAMNGRIAFRSKAGSGCVCSVKVPLEFECLEKGVDLAGMWKGQVGGRRIALLTCDRNVEKQIGQLVKIGRGELVLWSSERDVIDWSGERLDLLLVDLDFQKREPGAFFEMLRASRSAIAEVPAVVLTPWKSVPIVGALQEKYSLIVAKKPILDGRLLARVSDALAARAENGSVADGDAKCMAVAGESRGRTLRVLVVEDVYVNQQAILKMLASLEVEADLATDGMEAIAAVERSQYDLALIELRLPVMDGFEASKWIKRRLGKSAPKIVGVSAMEIGDIGDRCSEAEISSLIRKPISMTDLREVLGGISRQLI